MAKNKYQIAVNCFDRAEYSEAEKIMLELHRSNRKDFNVLNFLGILEMHKKNYSGAIAKFQKVVQLYSKHHFAHYNLGLSYQKLGEIDKAISCYEKTLLYDPKNIDAHNNLGVIMYARKEYDKAEKHYQKVLKFNPGNANAYNNLGNLYSAIEDLGKAEENYKTAVQAESGNSDFHFNLADCLLRLNKLDEAAEQLNLSLSINPKHHGALNSLAVVLIKYENYTQAEGFLKNLIVLEPNFAEAYHNLGICYQRMGENNKAVMLYQSALGNKNIRAQILLDIGNLFLKEGKYAESEQYFKDAEKVTDYKDTLYTNLGIAQLNQGHLEEALEYTKNALKENPDIAVSHYNLSHALLLNGDFEEGWTEYEWRKKRHGFIRREFEKPELSNLDVAGKTLYVYDEQGLGDSIQFARYLPLLKQLGAKIIFECDQRLTELFSGLQGFDQLIGRINYNEPSVEYDNHIALLSLPMLFNTNINTIPAEMPYLSVENKLLVKWEKQLGNKKAYRVGIVWAGNPDHNNDKNRSCPLQKFIPLINLDGFEFYSLQKGPGLQQVKTEYLEKLTILDDRLSTLSETAAVIQHMDLVISVDTSVTHLAGALGSKILTILPFFPDWRWLMYREDSPWYPSMKLVRQKSGGDWDQVINDVKMFLIEFAANRNKQYS